MSTVMVETFITGLAAVLGVLLALLPSPETLRKRHEGQDAAIPHLWLES